MNENLVKVTVRINTEDHLKLQELARTRNVKYNSLVRLILQAYCKQERYWETAKEPTHGDWRRDQR